MKSQSSNSLGAGSWTGRQQAFALMAAKCSLAQARCLRQIRESHAYREYGISWDQFCVKYAGISRSKADRIIRQFKEFGDTYFRLTEIASLSDETYRKLAPHIQDDQTIVIAGEQIPILPENAPRIRAAIQTFREEIRDLQIQTLQQQASLLDLDTKLTEFVKLFRHRAQFPLPTEERQSLVSLLNYTILRLNHVAAGLAKSAY